MTARVSVPSPRICESEHIPASEPQARLTFAAVLFNLRMHVLTYRNSILPLVQCLRV